MWVGMGSGPTLYFDDYIALTIVLVSTSEEAKRFEDGLQEHKDFLAIQRKYVSLIE